MPQPLTDNVQNGWAYWVNGICKFLEYLHQGCVYTPQGRMRVNVLKLAEETGAVFRPATVEKDPEPLTITDTDSIDLNLNPDDLRSIRVVNNKLLFVYQV